MFNSIPPHIIEELDRRGKLLNRKKDNENLSNLQEPSISNRYISQNNAWIRLISSVDVDEDSIGEYSDKLAKNFILTGGEYSLNTGRKQGLDLRENDTETSYRVDPILGIRPEMGITSFNINHKGTYGAVREATLNFNVWTKVDLDRAERLYLRPGVHAIVEWGHSLDSFGAPVELPSLSKYFEFSSRKEVFDHINKYREGNPNYEGFIGLITNFSFELRIDGGYDCSIRIISLGALIESLTAIRSEQIIPLKELPQNEDEQKIINRSTLHALHYYLTKNKWLTSNRSVVRDLKIEVNSFSIPNTLKQFIKQLPTNTLPIIGYDFIDFKPYDIETTGTRETSRYRYIPLRYLLMILNASELIPFNVSQEKLIEFYAPEASPDSIGGEQEDPLETEYSTLREHFSLKPYKIILPKTPVYFSNTSQGEIEKDLLKSIRLPGLNDGVLQSISKKVRSHKILDLLIELGTVVKVLDRFISTDVDGVEQINVYDFIKDLLTQYNSALGNITDLDLHYVEHTEGVGKYIIVDRGHVKDGITADTIAKLDVAGLTSVGSNISIKTRITNALSSQIAISAQGNTFPRQGDSNSNLPLIEWNRGIRDRFVGKIVEEIPEPTLEAKDIVRSLIEHQREFRDINPNRIPSYPTLSIRRKTDFIEDFLTPLQKIYENIGPTTTITSNPSDGRGSGIATIAGSFKESDFKELFKYGHGYFISRKYGNLQRKQEEGQEIYDSGIIPVELSWTLIGIGGLKIAELFRVKNIDKFLPDVYKKYGFILTGIDHTIENNQWKTTIRALTFKIERQ